MNTWLAKGHDISGMIHCITCSEKYALGGS